MEDGLSRKRYSGLFQTIAVGSILLRQEPSKGHFVSSFVCRCLRVSVCDPTLPTLIGGMAKCPVWTGLGVVGRVPDAARTPATVAHCVLLFRLRVLTV